MKSLLIVGANSDIAKAVARQYAKSAYDLVLAARHPEALTIFAQDLKVRYGIQVRCVFLDILDFSSHYPFYKTLEESLAGVLVAVGYLGDQALAEKNIVETCKIIDTNYAGVVSLLNIIANDFESRKSGFIIGISSIAGDRGRKSNYLYGSAKAALTTYLSGLRNRLYPNKVHVLTVKPGFVDTKMTTGLLLPRLLVATPERVAKDIFNAQKKGRNTLYTGWYWQWILLVIRLLPEFIFKRARL